jgi:hypothetical protein
MFLGEFVLIQLHTPPATCGKKCNHDRPCTRKPHTDGAHDCQGDVAGDVAVPAPPVPEPRDITPADSEPSASYMQWVAGVIRSAATCGLHQGDRSVEWMTEMFRCAYRNARQDDFVPVAADGEAHIKTVAINNARSPVEVLMQPPSFQAPPVTPTPTLVAAGGEACPICHDDVCGSLCPRTRAAPAASEATRPPGGGVSALDGSAFDAFLDDEHHEELTDVVRPSPPDFIWIAAPITRSVRFTGSGVRVSSDKPELGKAWAVAGPYDLRLKDGCQHASTDKSGRCSYCGKEPPFWTAPAPPVSTVAMTGSTAEDRLPRDPATGLPLRVDRDEVAALVALARLNALEEVYASIGELRIKNSGEAALLNGVLKLIRSLASPSASSSTPEKPGS